MYERVPNVIVNAGPSDNFASAHNGDVAHPHKPSLRTEVSSSMYAETDWFHGLITREETEKLLHGSSDGAFLIRESTNFPGDYTLSVAFEGGVEHYRVQQRNGKLTCDDEEFFNDLTALVLHYKRDADGLCHRLVTVVPKRTKSSLGEDAVDSSKSVSIPTSDSADLDLKTKQLRDAGWTIARHEVRIGETIGKGEFGDVLVGTYKDRKVAVKTMKNSSRMAESFLSEASVMTSVTHPNLVRLLGVVLDDLQHLYIVTEFMPNGSLVDYLRSRGRLNVTKLQQLTFACDACAGMAYLESKNMVHRDLAARNILLATDMTAKVSDFGLAKEIDALRATEDASGKFPIKWTAPEALRYTRFTNKSDVWSFGVLLWEIYSFGRVPYPRVPVCEVVRHIEKGYRMETPESCPTEIATLMADCWQLYPEDRPNFNQCLQRLHVLREQRVV